MGTMLSTSEKYALLNKTLGENHGLVGKKFSAASAMMDGLRHISDSFSLSELIPALSSYLFGPVTSPSRSEASLVSTLLYPLHQSINLINSNETGQRMYAYRAAAYAITSWAFNKPIPTKSPQILQNIAGGDPYSASNKTATMYNEVWQVTSKSVLHNLRQACISKGIDEKELKIIFKAFGNGNATQLCFSILKCFEKEFGNTAKHIWKTGYNIKYPA